jgi:threonine dehydrogenase-like Zn-dependent dehydrogenase
MTSTMEAAIFSGPGALSIEERPVPRPVAPTDAVLEVEACGICGTDLQILADPPGHPANAGIVLGHEIVGRVVEVGAEADRAVGERVAVDPDIRCNVCDRCRSGDPANCQRLTAMGVDIDGGLAGYCLAPTRALYPIAEETPTSSAAMVEPLACVLNGVRRLVPRPGETALIAGGGPIGALFLKMLRAAGVGPIAVADLLDSRRKAAEAYGADLSIDPADGPVGEAIMASWGQAPDVVVDASGSALSDALAAVADGGRILLFGMNERARGKVPQYDITRRELTVIGSYISRYTFGEAVRLIDRGVIDPSDLVTDQLPLGELARGLEMLRTGQALKVLIRP